jgi:hypothetical protein
MISVKARQCRAFSFGAASLGQWSRPNYREARTFTDCPSATPKMRHAARRLRHRTDMVGGGVTIPR